MLFFLNFTILKISIMKKIFLLSFFAIIMSEYATGQSSRQSMIVTQDLKQSMTVTVVEYASFLTGAASHMLITFPDGNQETIELKGLFSVANFINEKNLKSNDNLVTMKLNELQKQGWKIINVTTAVHPDNNNSPCIILTRYILRKS
ncbi:hypothetical protein AT05_04050 [Schleiferia thermophila str. Yellowstone]|nr:hypothetical protein AT05_04050 [Schleiferia thermophila str. Yellowstone]